MGFLKDPLIHFLFVGLILFAGYSALNPNSIDSNEREIFVDREDLLGHLRYQNRTIGAADLERALDSMSPNQRQVLIEAYIREEALFREAKALGLDRQDPVARRRLIQNLEYITTSFVAVDDQISDEAVRIYFDEQQE